MSTATPNVLDILRAAGITPPPGAAGRRFIERISTHLENGKGIDSRELFLELLRAEQQRDQAQASCAKAVEAAENVQRLLESLINGHATAYRLEAVHETPAGLRAICRLGEQLRELSVHPDVPIADLKRVQPWEFVRVHENMVVGTWVDDPFLIDNSYGEVVTFQGYADHSTLARVARLGNVEEIVRLAPPLCQQVIPLHSKLVLLRDNPRWAVAWLPAQQTTSRFEVPIDTIDTQLSDLACVESIAEKLLLEVVKRVIAPQIRLEFNLDPLRGLLLCSNKPGMGKTAFMRAFARKLRELGQQRGFDVVLYLVKPNEFKSMWHGEDARIVREELFGAIRARREIPRTRPLVQLVVMDEIDALGRRPEARDAIVSSAQSDALESFLVEMDGMVQERQTEPQAHLLVVGMTNRPERIDDALKRPGRLGDEVFDIPDLDIGGAEQVCLIYTRANEIPWYVDDTVRRGLAVEEISRRFLRPAMSAVFNAVVLRYYSDTQKKFEVTAGQVLAAVHYRKAMSVAKNRAAERRLRGLGIPGVAYEDLVEGLLETSCSVAAQMQADPHMLIRHLRITTPVARVEVSPREELERHRFSQTV